jgi:hypothetical protein
VDVYFNVFLTSALVGGEGSFSLLGRLTLKEGLYPLNRRFGGPQSRSGRCGEINWDSKSDISGVLPVASRYTVRKICFIHSQRRFRKGVKWSDRFTFCGLENRDYSLRDLRWPRDTLCPQKLILYSPTSGGRSVGIVRSQTKATELVIIVSCAYNIYN